MGNNNQEDDCCELLFLSELDGVNGPTGSREKAQTNAALAVQQTAISSSQGANNLVI